MPFSSPRRRTVVLREGEKNGKTMQKWSGFDVLTIFLCSFVFLIFYRCSLSVSVHCCSCDFIDSLKEAPEKGASFMLIMLMLFSVDTVYRLAVDKALNIASENIHQPCSCFKTCPGYVRCDDGLVGGCQGIITCGRLC